MFDKLISPGPNVGASRYDACNRSTLLSGRTFQDAPGSDDLFRVQLGCQKFDWDIDLTRPSSLVQMPPVPLAGHESNACAAIAHTVFLESLFQLASSSLCASSTTFNSPYHTYTQEMPQDIELFTCFFRFSPKNECFFGLKASIKK